MLRMMVKEDISKYDLSSIKHMTTAGEALNLEVYKQFKKATGLRIMEGFGQTELTLTIANLVGNECKPGSMGKPVPLYDVELIDSDGNPVGCGQPEKSLLKTSDKVPLRTFSWLLRRRGKNKRSLARRLLPHGRCCVA